MMRVQKLAAAAAVAALAVLGAASLSHYGASEAVASARRPAAPSYVPPTVPAMHLGVTVGETTTTAPRPAH